MTATPDPIEPPVAEQPDPAVSDLEEDLSATRERLAASVEALAAKADVKAQASAKAQETAEQVKATAHRAAHQAQDGTRVLAERVRQLPPQALAVGALVVAVVVVLAVRRARRHSGV